MKAFLFTIGEATTEICYNQLKKFGFEIVVLDGQESISEKYKRFINSSDGDCLKIDADIILNENVKKIREAVHTELVTNYSCYDFFHNMPWAGGPTYYSKEAMKIIRDNLHEISPIRPEASACRLPKIHPRCVKSDLVVGIHGFFQHEQDIIRCIEQKKIRGQQNQFDFDLINELIKL